MKQLEEGIFIDKKGEEGRKEMDLGEDLNLYMMG